MGSAHTIEDIEIRRKRLVYRAWHRGTREMDLILGSFADKNAAGFSDAELDEFESLLQLQDPDLYNWITGTEPVPANLNTDLFEKLKRHKV
ncbi:MAG: succinate dehydrogenase assembly factor 2 [Alphaproteobacteria bacterium]|jgi:antitoxin CptB|nr:succinate dehydrogenase assembly factor 2 [Alphaproteobacteria bacterium]